MTEERILENARCWGLIGRNCEMGLPFSQAVALAENSCKDAELRPLFDETLETLQMQGELPLDWKREIIPASTVALLSFGLPNGTLHVAFTNASLLLETHVAYLRRPSTSDVADREALFFFYFKTLLESGVAFPRTLEVLRDELRLPGSEEMIGAMIRAMMSGSSVLSAMKSAEGFFSPSSLEIFANWEKTGDFSVFQPFVDKMNILRESDF